MKIKRKISKSISPFMKSMGFSCTGNGFYYIQNDIAYCIAIDIPGGLVYVTAYVMPLYIPCECQYYTYGNRLNTAHGITLPLLQKDSDDRVLEEWCNSLCCFIKKTIMPFYSTVDTPIKLLEHFEGKKNNSLIASSCPEIFCERLKMFTWLYLGDTAQAEKSISKINQTLITNTFFTETVRQHYLDEVHVVHSLIKEGQSSIQDLLINNIANTKSFFP